MGKQLEQALVGARKRTQEYCHPLPPSIPDPTLHICKNDGRWP